MSKRTNNKVVKKVAVVAPKVTNTYSIVSPKGKVYAGISNLTAFARRFNLDASALGKVARGQRTQHKNWRVQG